MSHVHENDLEIQGIALQITYLPTALLRYSLQRLLFIDLKKNHRQMVIRKRYGKITGALDWMYHC